MTYLVDANVLGEPTQPAPDAKVLAWLMANEADFAVDPIILGELRNGILMLPAGRKRAQLQQRTHSVRRNNRVAAVMAATVNRTRKARSALIARRPVFLRTSSLKPWTA